MSKVNTAILSLQSVPVRTLLTVLTVFERFMRFKTVEDGIKTLRNVHENDQSL